MGLYKIHFKTNIPNEMQSDDFLVHFGIKGQKWGIRRFQNDDGTYTAAGRERYGISGQKKAIEKAAYKAYDAKVKSSKFTNDPEIRDIYAMERVDKSHSYSKACSDKEKALMTKIEFGDKISDKELNNLKKSSSEHYIQNFDLEKKREAILKKNDAWSKNKPIEELPESDQKELNRLFKKMSDNRKAYAETEYAVSKALDNKYADDISKETDKRYIDPSFQKFDSKEAKAQAEADYLKRIWYGDPEEKDIDKWNRELDHIVNRVTHMSMDGDEGLPRSDRNKALYDYVDTWDSFDRYDNWHPKYEKSSEYKELQAKRNRIAEETGYNKAKSDYYNRPVGLAMTDRQNTKLWDAYIKARNKYEKRVEVSGIKSAEKEIEKNFEQQIMKNVLLDIGYEVTDSNLKYIEGLIWYD